MEAFDLFQHKTKPLAELCEIIGQLRAEGKRIALTNGSFDLMHVGHLHYFRGAKKQADIVVAAVNSDASVRAIKGDTRPYINEAGRMLLVAALEDVDYVTITDEPNAETILHDIRPDIYVKGPDFTADTVPGRDIVLSYGGQIVITGDSIHSSTGVIERIKDKHR